MTRNPKSCIARLARLGAIILLPALMRNHGQSADITDLSSEHTPYVCVVDLAQIRKSPVVTSLTKGDSITAYLTNLLVSGKPALGPIWESFPEGPELVKLFDSTDTLMVYTTEAYPHREVMVCEGKYTTESVIASLNSIAIKRGIRFTKRKQPDGTHTFFVMASGLSNSDGVTVSLLSTGQLVMCDVRDTAAVANTNLQDQGYTSKSRCASVVAAMRTKPSGLVASAEVQDPTKAGAITRFDIRRRGIIQRDGSLMYYTDVRHDALLATQETVIDLTNQRNALVNSYFDLPVARIFHQSEVEVDDKIVRFKIQIPNEVVTASFPEMVHLHLERFEKLTSDE